MSNHLAIATVTATLAQFLQGVVERDVAGLTVTTTRPDTGAAGQSPSSTSTFIKSRPMPPGAIPIWRRAMTEEG